MATTEIVIAENVPDVSGKQFFLLGEAKSFAVRVQVLEGVSQAKLWAAVSTNPTVVTFTFFIESRAGTIFSYTITTGGDATTTASRMASAIQADATNGVSAAVGTRAGTNDHILYLTADDYGAVGNDISVSISDATAGNEGKPVAGVLVFNEAATERPYYFRGGQNDPSPDATVTYNIKTTLTSQEDDDGYSILDVPAGKSTNDVIEAFGWKTIADYSPLVPFHKITVSWASLARGASAKTAYVSIYAKTESE
jgi:hypothetical protein